MSRLRRAFAIGGACLLGLSGYGYFAGSPWFYKHVVMPAAGHMDPERAHVTAVYLASKGLVAKDRTTDPDILVRTLTIGRCTQHICNVAAAMTTN